MHTFRFARAWWPIAAAAAILSQTLVLR